MCFFLSQKGSLLRGLQVSDAFYSLASRALSARANWAPSTCSNGPRSRVLIPTTHMSEQKCQLPFLSPHPLQPWTLVLEGSPDLSVLNMTEHLQEIATRRHRLYLIRCTLRLQAQHYHIRIAGLLPAKNKMLGHYRAIDPPCYRLVHIPQVLHRMAAHLHDRTTVYPLASGRNEVFLLRSGIMLLATQLISVMCCINTWLISA